MDGICHKAHFILNYGAKLLRSIYGKGSSYFSRSSYFFGVAYLTSTQATVNEMLNELRLPSPLLVQLIWSTFIVPLSSIMMILLAAFLYFGLKTKWRFIYMGGYFILAVILYPYIYLKFDQNNGALTQAPFLVEILQIETMQIVLDGILFIGIYALLYWFVKNKIEL